MSVPTRTGQGAQVRGPRVNAKPALIVFVLVGLFIFGIMYAAQKRNEVPGRNQDSGAVFDLAITADNRVDFLQDKPDGLAGITITEPAEPELAEGNTSTLKQDMADWMERQQMEKLQRNESLRTQYERRQIERYEAALASPMQVSGFGDAVNRVTQIRAASNTLSASTLPTSNTEQSTGAVNKLPENPDTAGGLDRSQLATLMQSDAGRQVLSRLGLDSDAMTTPEQSLDTETSGVDRSNRFVAQNAISDRFTLDAELKAPRTPYEISTGTVMSGSMISAVNSDLPGDILAQVSRDVYDSASGQYLLIPKGTRLFGRYDAFTQLGQERLLIVWNRLIFEDGETLDIGGMQGYDQRGLSGFQDRVNTHFLRTLGNALLISVVNAAGEEIVNQVSESENAAFTLNLAQNFAQNTNTAFDDYLRSRLRIKPTIQIRAGYRFNIIVSKDIRFARPFERGFKAYNTYR